MSKMNFAATPSEMFASAIDRRDPDKKAQSASAHAHHLSGMCEGYVQAFDHATTIGVSNEHEDYMFKHLYRLHRAARNAHLNASKLHKALGNWGQYRHHQLKAESHK